MKRFLFSFFLLGAGVQSSAQLGFDPHIDFEIQTDVLLVPQSLIQKQVLFIGGVHN